MAIAGHGEGKAAQVAGHTRRALNNGVTPAEIGEVITHLALYSGWPNAISAVAEAFSDYSRVRGNGQTGWWRREGSN